MVFSQGSIRERPGKMSGSSTALTSTTATSETVPSLSGGLWRTNCVEPCAALASCHSHKGEGESLAGGPVRTKGRSGLMFTICGDWFVVDCKIVRLVVAFDVRAVLTRPRQQRRECVSDHPCVISHVVRSRAEDIKKHFPSFAHCFLEHLSHLYLSTAPISHPMLLPRHTSCRPKTVGVSLVRSVH